MQLIFIGDCWQYAVFFICKKTQNRIELGSLSELFIRLVYVRGRMHMHCTLIRYVTNG